MRNLTLSVGLKLVIINTVIKANLAYATEYQRRTQY